MGLEENQRWSGASNHATATSTSSRFETYFLQMQEDLPEKLWMQKSRPQVLQYVCELRKQLQ